MICPRCGFTNAPGSETCARCGNTLLPGGSFVQERRWVSVVFFDLSRFTEYALAHPLEDTWQAANSALQSAAGHARLFGGHIDKFFGDGFLSVFGVPRSQESDARAALEAARAMVASSPLPGRAGVASGLVLRTPLGGGLAGDQTVLGPAVNLSQRLSQAAPPGEVWADTTTMRLVSTALGEALPPQPLKGYAEPLTPFRYAGLRSGSGNLVGRSTELRQLQELLQKVGSSGRRVILSGPMGVGKSYLAQHFVATLPEGVQGLVAPRLTAGVALRYALRQGLQDLLKEGLSGLRELELPERLRSILTFSIGLDEHPGLPSSELDALLVETWWQVLAKVAEKGPLVMVLEDLHNADPTVLEFSRRQPPPGVLLLLVARQNRWGSASDLVSLELAPLSLEHTQILVLQARPELGTATSLHLAEASGGFPLAIQALSLTNSGEPEPIPLYQPRLDSLPRLARVALQASAVLGPTVPPELVRHLVGEEADLTRLVGEGFLEADEHGQLKFAIPWLREATLGQVGGQQVQQWHQQAARWYQREGRLAESAGHLESAGEVTTAYRLWRVVAQTAWSEENYAGAILGYLEALRLAEGSVRLNAALEAAEAHLALGRYLEASELADLALQAPETPQVLRERALAIRLEASLELGQPEPLTLSPAATQEPRLRLALARTLPPAEARRLLGYLPSNLESQSHLILARGWLAEGHLVRAQAECEMYLDQSAATPAGRFQARILLAQTLWRQFKPQDAWEALSEEPGEVLPAWFSAWHQATKAALALDLGDLAQAERLLERALVLTEEAPDPCFERVSSVYLRYLEESGQLREARSFGEVALARTPTPLLLAHLVLIYALTPGQAAAEMLGRLLRGLEGVQDLEVRALCALATGFRAQYEGRPARESLRRAALLARQAHHPTLYFYALIALGQELESRDPKKSLVLSQYLLSQTAGRGFEVGHGYARLLRAQALLGQGRETSSLLEFAPVTPLARAWQAALTSTRQGGGAVSPKALGDYGIVGVWARWLKRNSPWGVNPATPRSQRDIG
ncbi:MAG: AAA family ATPase [Thermaceae bacterium]|nr:AAA family ATPase [Thermaceae bacterium]